MDSSELHFHHVFDNVFRAKSNVLNSWSEVFFEECIHVAVFCLKKGRRSNNFSILGSISPLAPIELIGMAISVAYKRFFIINSKVRHLFLHSIVHVVAGVPEKTHNNHLINPLPFLLNLLLLDGSLRRLLYYYSLGTF